MRLLCCFLFLLLVAGAWIRPACASGNDSMPGFQESPTAKTVISYLHNKDCDFGCQSGLYLREDRSARLYVGGNRYGVMKSVSTGIYEGVIGQELYDELLNAFSDPLFACLYNPKPAAPGSMYRKYRFAGGKEPVRVDIYHWPDDPALLEYHERIEKLLEQARAELLARSPLIGFIVKPGKAGYEIADGMAVVTLRISNTGTEAYTLTPTLIGTFIYDGTVKSCELRDRTGEFTLEPGQSREVEIFGECADSEEKPTHMSYTAYVQVQSPALPEPLSLQYVDYMDF